MISSSIQLTAKKSHYGVDGTGRDSYINFDNGGNYRGHLIQGRGKFQIGTFRTQNIIKSRRTSAIEGRPMHYIGDGTGRDCYIITNEGGMSQTGKKFNFLQSLRSHVKRNQIKNDDLFSRTQDTWKSRGSSAASIKQKMLNTRLSAPKTYDDPYKQMRSTFRNSVGSAKFGFSK